MGSEWTGTLYEVLGPQGPHQSIHDGKTDCVVDLIKRSSTTPDSVCNGPKFEGAKLELDGAMESANEELPVIKGEALFWTTTRSRNWVDRHCLDYGHGWRKN